MLSVKLTLSTVFQFDVNRETVVLRNIESIPGVSDCQRGYREKHIANRKGNIYIYIFLIYILLTGTLARGTFKAKICCVLT